MNRARRMWFFGPEDLKLARMSILLSLMGILGFGFWDGQLKSDSQAKLWWYHKHDGTYYYPECRAEFVANESVQKFQVLKLRAHCTQGPYWDFEQKLDSVFDFEKVGAELYREGKKVGSLTPSLLRLRFFDRWDDEHVLLVRNYADEEGQVSHYFYWGVNSTDYVDFEIESYGLR